MSHLPPGRPAVARVLSRRRLLDDFFKVDELQLTVESDDGSTSAPQRRLVFERGDSVAALVRERATGDLFFTEQLRAPTLAHGSGWLLELMAGMIEPGESPEASLRRELVEELGFEPARLEAVSRFYVSPGGSSERIWLYAVEVDERSRIGDGGGVAHESEDIRVVRLPEAEARARLESGEIADAKTIIALQWHFARMQRG